MRVWLCVLMVGVAMAAGAAGQEKYQTDTFKTTAGDLRITFLGHATLMFRFGAVVVHVDPVSAYADYGAMPKADLVLVTHEHGDHLDPKAIQAVRTPGTMIIGTARCAASMPGVGVMRNGERQTVKGIGIEAVPAYNPARPFHPKGEGNGYVLTFGGTRILVAGDTEGVPEITALGGLDIAFLPMNMPYTMTPEAVAAAAKTMKPKVLYPYHYGSTDPAQLVALLKDAPSIEVRIRNLK